MSEALPPRDALALAVHFLERDGFVVSAWNERGDSVYLHRPGSPWHLRLSNHARTAKQRRRRTDILTSLIIARPRTREQVAALVLGALRDFAANHAKHDAVSPSALE